MKIKEKLSVTVQALRDISDPIGAMKRTLKPDEKLDGMYAVQLSKDPSYLQSLAREALTKVGE